VRIPDGAAQQSNQTCLERGNSFLQRLCIRGGGTKPKTTPA
jgi:hypothetical protein